MNVARGKVADEAALVESVGQKVTVVRGSPVNLKITSREDLTLAEQALKDHADRPRLDALLRACADVLDAFLARLAEQLPREETAAPPPTNVPRMDKNQLVPISALKFPFIPNFGVVNYAYAPRSFDWGPEYLTKGIVAWEPGHAGGAYPVLVPQVDADGNDVGGVRVPELVWPLMTYTGWNPRSPSIGSPGQQYSQTGSQAPFARDRKSVV